MKRKTPYLKKVIYLMSFLCVYVIVQHLWWAYYLMHLEAHPINDNKRWWMIFGESGVILLIMIYAFARLIISLRKEARLNEQKNNFLLSITHELKTPIAHNRLSIQTILKRPNLEAATRENLLQKILDENDLLNRLVEKILTATRLETRFFKPQQELFNYYELLEELLEKYAILLDDKEVIINTFSKKIYVNADKKMLETVIINLIENFHKYAGDSPSFKISITKLENRFKCSFIDEGKGIENRFKHDIFKKFIRGENEETRTQKGTGLGLYISKEFLKLNQGDIFFRQNQPKGAIFDVILPLK